MKEFQPFVKELQNHVAACPASPDPDWLKKANKYVDGLAYEALRRLVPLKDRRSSGAFFTGHSLAVAVLKEYQLNFEKEVVFYDPACGTANLLIAASQLFANDLVSENASVVFVGTDIHQQFVDAANLRFELLNKCDENKSADHAFEISRRNGLENFEEYQRATHILINPPFNKVDAPKGIEWAKGKVSCAALFMSVVADKIKSGTEVIAILPDVLRSGSRYSKWREEISSRFLLSDIHLLGQFDQYTDVDVFSVLLTKLEKPVPPRSIWTEVGSPVSKKVSDDFFVSVGPVVDNRDKMKGPERPYLVSKGLSGWTTETKCSRRRKYSGKYYTSPFVVIKRTSRAGDVHRTIATIINLPEPVYVDNHLIVLLPKSKKISACKKALKTLKSDATTKFVNQQIRCRHLTVKVVSSIPI